MEEPLQSSFAPPNYKPQKHVTFANSPIICSSVPFLYKDDEYSDDDDTEPETESNQKAKDLISLKEKSIFNSMPQNISFFHLAISLFIVFIIAFLLSYFDFFNAKSTQDNALSFLTIIPFVPIIRVIASNFMK